jgi:hypothetical protein
MAALDELRNKLAQARSRAMDEGRAYRVAFVPERGNYRIAPDSDEFWGNGGSGTSDSSAAKPLVVAGSLPQGCYFCEAVGVSGPASEGDTSMASEQVDPSSYQNLVTFLPNGNARDDGQVVLQTVGARPVIVRLKGSTSVVTTEEG